MSSSAQQMRVFSYAYSTMVRLQYTTKIRFRVIVKIEFVSCLSWQLALGVLHRHSSTCVSQKRQAN